MKPDIILKHVFVEYIPEQLEERTVYISKQFSTVTHKCVCGCGREVVTPLSPTDWKLTSDGRTISLFPSIGSWNLPCRSHYWIKNDRAIWAADWTDKQVEAGRAYEGAAKQRYYRELEAAQAAESRKPVPPVGLWQRFLKWLFG